MTKKSTATFDGGRIANEDHADPKDMVHQVYDAKGEDVPDVPVGSKNRPVAGMMLRETVMRRMNRRTLLKGAAAMTPMMLVTPVTLLSGGRSAKASSGKRSGLSFKTLPGSDADAVLVADGHKAEVLIRWGESLFDGVPDLDTSTLADPAQSELITNPDAAALQAQRFGYNCDLNLLFPLGDDDDDDDDDTEHALLWTNHEFTTDELMFAGWPPYFPDAAIVKALVSANPQLVGVMKAAHGGSVIEIRRDRAANSWSFVKSSRFNRRITGDTPMEITGPAAGDALLKTDADPDGALVLGMLNNCAGGKTPWGTVLTCEENFDQYFGNFDVLAARAADPGEPQQAFLQQVVDFHRRIPLPGGQSQRAWELVDQRFDIGKHPTESFRFGWVVEIDPQDPDFVPRKRTALGRFKHEGATAMLGKSGRVGIYSGDDARDEYVYKFVSKDRMREEREENFDLLDDGTLFAARLNDDGSGDWLPLVFGAGPLTPANGFASQAEVLINARAAADLLGATPMDRPEDIQPDQKTGKVYIALTNNTRRTGDDPSDTRTAQGRTVSAFANIPNPRSGDDVGGAGSDFDGNPTGHIIEIAEHDRDAEATTFTWEILLLCGNPKDPTPGAQFIEDSDDLTALPLNPRDSYWAGQPAARADEISPIGSPDNIAVDKKGNLWVSTDGQFKDLELYDENGNRAPINDGVYAVPVTGRDRGIIRQFLSGPKGCEICGPEFDRGNRLFVVGIQHPGEGGTLAPGDSVSDWPDGNGLPPRPSVLAIVKERGTGSKRIGTGISRRDDDDDDEHDGKDDD